MPYKILMRNVLTLAEYATPTNVLSIGCERLIVERREADGAYLTITEAGKCDPSEIDPPKNLKLGNTLVGTLIRSDLARNRETFIFNRDVPAGLVGDMPSAFFPGDGCVEVEWTGSRATLRASGRHLHGLSETGVVIHKCEPFEDPSEGLTWLFDAIRVPWSGEETPNTEEL
ncbi:hypothetical protein [uncultured Sulfitobacter sp.]|uniref:hypothetical protein n=1 Tax=uncultured Sulfitobacter sp. TaxID=191468 RepID=UPI00262B6B59|nr:hypothetical protein [uncultured Sulfitobacter sp.]